MSDFTAYDRVHETCSAPGTGTVTLLGAVAGRRSFAAVGNATKCYYIIEDQSGSNWEVGRGTYTVSGTTLTHDAVFSNSLGTTAKINFSSGTQNVFLDIPATIINQALLSSTTARIYGRKTAAGGPWEECTLSNILDFIGTSKGDILFRDTSTWAKLSLTEADLVLRSDYLDTGLPVWAFSGAIRVKNTSGATANRYSVGYIDNAGEFKTTTTTNLNGVAWCVVDKAGANNVDITVVTRGRVPVLLNANCSAGNYLSLSSTAGQASVGTVMRPDVFAIALSGNASGAGGVCEALLITQTTFVAASNPEYAFFIQSHDNTAFVATINGAPSTTSVVYNTPSAGNENVLPTTTTDNWGKIRLRNTTRGNFRLLSSCNPATNTITTVASTDNWTSGDTISVESPTVASGATAKYIEIDTLNTGFIPPLTRLAVFELYGRDSNTAGKLVSLHPLETFGFPKSKSQFNQLASLTIPNLGHVAIELVGGVFTVQSTAGASTSKTTALSLQGYYLATP